jgi:hypothetical protein
MDKPFNTFAPLTESELSAGMNDGTNARRAREAKAIPPPADAEPGEKAAARLFGRPPDHLWCYAMPDGRIAFYSCRWDFTDGKKTYRPLSWFEGEGWAPEAWSDSRPLYRLDAIAANGNAPIVICEGEKAADAAARIFPNSVATTSSGGANAAAKTDWAPLAGRRVLIWPDNDEAGTRYAEEVAASLAAQGCNISVIDAGALAALNPAGGAREAPDKWDAANAAVEWPKWSHLGALRKAAVNLAKASIHSGLRQAEHDPLPELEDTQDAATMC